MRLWCRNSASFVQPLERLIAILLSAFVVFSLISISAMQTAYILALVAWLLQLCLGGGAARVRLPLLLPVCGYFLASVLASVTALAPYRSLLELRNVFEVAIFYLAVNHVTTVARATTLTRVLIAVGALMALYGLGQSIVHGADFRIHGTMSIYMTFAGLLMLVSVMALAQLLYQAERRLVLWCLPALLLQTAALLMTQTRNAWLGLLAGGAMVLGFRQRLLLLLLPVIALAAFLLVPGAVQERLRSLVDPHQITARHRLYVWHNAIQLIQHYPWTGVGMRNIPRPVLEYHDPDDPNATKRLQHLHNNLLQVAAERGLIGLAWWLAIWSAYVSHTWSLYWRLGPQDGMAKALVAGSMASIVSFHIAGLFENNFGDSEVISLVYFLMALPFIIKPQDLRSAATK
jgi:O-antigen ligase